MSASFPIRVDTLVHSRPALGAYLERLVSGPPPEAAPWSEVCIILASGPTAKALDALGYKNGWYTPPWAPDLRISTAPRRESCVAWRAGGMASLAAEVDEEPTATPIVYYFGPGPKFICSVMWVELEGGAG